MDGPDQHTFALLATAIYARARDQHIVDDGEAAFTAHPPPISRYDPGIVKTGGLVKQYASAVDRPCKGNLIGVEVVEG